MPSPFPFNLNPDKYSRQLWSKQAYLYIAEFFRTAQFDSSVQAVAGDTIDDYRHSGPADDWRLPCGGGTAGGYLSYFRLVDITDAENGCRLAVTNGETTPESENCGVVKVNGSTVDVATYTSAAITAAGTIYFWIHTWRDAVDGYDAEIRITTSSMRPDNPNGGIAWASEPVGSCTIESDGGGGYRVKAGTLRQDFLKGGDHLEILTANCSGWV